MTNRLEEIQKEIFDAYEKASDRDDSREMAQCVAMLCHCTGVLISVNALGDFECTEKGLAVAEKAIRNSSEISNKVIEAKT